MKSMTDKTRKQKSIRYRCVVFVLVFCMGVFLSFSLCAKNSYAYTREEIEAAKAWLSGHGYSPDAGGAAQAYNDYLNGKFGEVPGAPPIEQQTPESEEQPPATDATGTDKKKPDTKPEQSIPADDTENQAEQPQEITAPDESKTVEDTEKTDTADKAATTDKKKDSKNPDEELDAFLTDKVGGNAADFITAISEADSGRQEEREVDESLKVTVERTDKASEDVTEAVPSADNENAKEDGINETVIFLLIIVSVLVVVLILRGVAVRRRNRK